MAQLVVVSVGTDHHRFDRLVKWVASWAQKHSDVKVLIQRGTADAPADVETHEVIPHDELCQLFVDADAVVCHGGPSTVMDARKAGRFPIVVPRNPEFGEHVDGHQLAFAEHLDRHGVAHVVHEFEDVFAAITSALADPDLYSVSVNEQSLLGVMAFGNLMDNLLGSRTELGHLAGNPDLAPQSFGESARAVEWDEGLTHLDDETTLFTVESGRNELNKSTGSSEVFEMSDSERAAEVRSAEVTDYD